MFMNIDYVTVERITRLLSKVARNNLTIDYIKSLVDKLGLEARKEIDDLITHIFIKMLREEDIRKWEIFMGITSDLEDTLKMRQDYILYRLNNRDCCTPQLIIDMANSFMGTDIGVVEHFNAYAFEITMNLNELPARFFRFKEWLYEAKLAHLDVIFNKKKEIDDDLYLVDFGTLNIEMEEKEQINDIEKEESLYLVDFGTLNIEMSEVSN